MTSDTISSYSGVGLILLEAKNFQEVIVEEITRMVLRNLCNMHPSTDFLWSWVRARSFLTDNVAQLGSSEAHLSTVLAQGRF